MKAGNNAVVSRVLRQMKIITDCQKARATDIGSINCLEQRIHDLHILLTLFRHYWPENIVIQKLAFSPDIRINRTARNIINYRFLMG
ncbi:hypothetical protein BFS13_08705 [Pantoea sp. Ae16]|nr:hypothetical protein BFS13_08705 [Pantoea sp. Ae16]